MARIKLKFVTTDVDANGNVRYYFRKCGRQKTRLRGLPGSEEFMKAYNDALSGTLNGTPQPAILPKASLGSFRATLSGYFASGDFRRLDPATQAWQRRALEAISREHGDKPIDKLEARHIRAWRDAKAERTPTAANTMLKAIRSLFRWALEADLVTRDPSRDVRKVKHVSAGHHAWTLEEVEQFEAKHPIGSKARLAMALLLYTGCRREDVVRLGRQHLKDGRLKYVQAKNEHRNPVEINMPVLDELATIIEATPSGHLPFLVTGFGKPFTANGFGGKFKDWCVEAGLPHCSAHGLRKALATRLADQGATPHEIMAITGHKTLSEVERYTKSARQSKLADSAMSKL